MPRRGVLLQGRLRWLLLGLFLLLLLFTYLLECTPPAGPAPPGLGAEPYGKEHYQALLQEHEERHLSRASSLKRQIAQLKLELQEMSEKLKVLQEQKEPPGILGDKDPEPGDLLDYLHSQVDKAEVTTGARLPSEYALVPFESFTASKVYQLETGLTRHPEEKPVRKDRRDELVEVIEAALDIINNPDEDDGVDEDVPMQRTYTDSHFTEGPARQNPERLLQPPSNRLLLGRTVPDGAGQGDALRALLHQGGLRQLPPRHALQALRPGSEGPQLVCGDGGDDRGHHRPAGGPSGHLPAVLAQLQVGRCGRDFTHHALLWCPQVSRLAER